MSVKRERGGPRVVAVVDAELHDTPSDRAQLHDHGWCRNSSLARKREDGAVVLVGAVELAATLSVAEAEGLLKHGGDVAVDVQICIRKESRGGQHVLTIEETVDRVHRGLTW